MVTFKYENLLVVLLGYHFVMCDNDELIMNADSAVGCGHIKLTRQFVSRRSILQINNNLCLSRGIISG